MRASIEDLITASMVNRIRLYENLGRSDEFILEAIRGVMVDNKGRAQRPTNRTERRQVANSLRSARAENRAERDMIKSNPSDDDTTRRKENYLADRSAKGVASSYMRDKDKKMTEFEANRGAPIKAVDRGINQNHYGDDNNSTAGVINTKAKRAYDVGPDKQGKYVGAQSAVDKKSDNSGLGDKVKKNNSRSDAHSGHIINFNDIRRNTRAGDGKAHEGDGSRPKRAGFVYDGSKLSRPQNPEERKQLADAIKSVRKENRDTRDKANASDSRDKSDRADSTRGFRSMKPVIPQSRDAYHHKPLERKKTGYNGGTEQTGLGYKIADADTNPNDGKPVDTRPKVNKNAKGILTYPRK